MDWCETQYWRLVLKHSYCTTNAKTNDLIQSKKRNFNTTDFTKRWPIFCPENSIVDMFNKLYS